MLYRLRVLESREYILQNHNTKICRMGPNYSYGKRIKHLIKPVKNVKRQVRHSQKTTQVNSDVIRKSKYILDQSGKPNRVPVSYFMNCLKLDCRNVNVLYLVFEFLLFFLSLRSLNSIVGYKERP